MDSGKTIAQIKSEMQEAEATKQADSFNWQWLRWFEDNNPEKYAEYSAQKSQYQRWDHYLSERGVPGSGKDINFSSYRSKIADPSFVDELEIAYSFEKSTLSSIDNMSTLNAWKGSAVNSFKQECEDRGDMIVTPLTESDLQKQNRDILNAEADDEKMKLMSAELEKDFEQIDAERLLCGQETLQMALSEHPQYAEMLEDSYSARQTFLDFAMMPYHMDYVKRERLAVMQTEERRKQFLERFDVGSKVLNGVDCTVPA